MRFRDEYFFLSNFYPCEITVWGIAFPTSEHLYVASKTTDTDLRREISKLTTPGKAKRFGHGIELRPDWEKDKILIMEDILHCKFIEQHPALGIRLNEIPGEIIEHNLWHDNFWGVCECGECADGQNILGSLLMKLREPQAK